VSKGTSGYAIPLVGASIVEGTCPVQRLPRKYRGAVAANWSIKNETDTGFYLTDPISNLNSNLLIGRQRQSTALRLHEDENTFYLKGSWLVKPSNLLAGNVSIDLTALLSNPETITQGASRYWLMTGRPGDRDSQKIEGIADGNLVRFLNVPLLETATYHLVWKRAH
jgi:hypothetical protein